MLIVNADDLGRCTVATDRILACFSAGRICAASLMVFMEDSERAAALAKVSGLDAGLHINFTESFTGSHVPHSLRRSHERIRRFLRQHKYALLFYNPFLRAAFREVFQAQAEEFTRLYGQPASRMDGHQHMHLCSNMLFDHVLPLGMQVRRSFSFAPGEKSLFNRCYRRTVDRQLARKYRVTDFFFALSQSLEPRRLRRVMEIAKTAKVEMMTHPQVDLEFAFLLSDDYAQALSAVQSVSFERARHDHAVEFALKSGT